MAQTEEKLPEWMLRLENKRKKQHRLAHEIGAGAPCFVCGDKCPGLDLHFWRKLCRNCKCKKEDHDVKDDEGYEQFEILLGSDKRKTRKGGYLNIKVPEDIHSPKKPHVNPNKGIAFDWIPPNVSDDVAAEYMRQLPAGKLPISGSDGALYRRQQMEKQVPLHDLNAEHCHNLTTEETEQLMKYLENLKNNVVGLGCVGKVPALYSETRVPLMGPIQQHALNQTLGRPLATSQSADPIRPLPPMPPVYNSAPRPFHASTPSSAYGSGEEDDVPPPLPTSLPPRTDLRTPSEFIDWRLSDDRQSSMGKIAGGVQNTHLPSNVPPEFVGNNFSSSVVKSNELSRQMPQLSGKLPSNQHPVLAKNKYNLPSSCKAASQDVALVAQQYSSILGGSDPKDAFTAFPQNSDSYTGNLLPSRLQNQGAAIPREEGYVDHTLDVLSGEKFPYKGADSQNITDKIQGMKITSSFPQGVVSSSSVNHAERTQVSKPLGSQTNLQNKAIDSFSLPVEQVGTMPMQETLTSNFIPSTIAHSEGIASIPGMSIPLGGKNRGNVGGTKTGDGNAESAGKWKSYPPGNALPVNPNLSVSSMTSGIAHSENVGGERGVAHSMAGNMKGGLKASSLEMQYGTPSANQLAQSTSLPVDGVLTSNITPQSIIQSSAVGTDAIPKSAEILEQEHGAMFDPMNVIASAGSSGRLPSEASGGSTEHLDCRECGLKLIAGDVAVFAERAGNAAWHPGCFVCTTCKELLVDLMYFYHNESVYCGRHFAELLGIPRCFACDELIFVKEYTMAEEKLFHVKHFCCYECDTPLAGKQYISVEEQPVCLECYDRMYGKMCHTCKNKIAPSEQRVGWKDLNWHVQGNCFRCYECAKSLLGGRFMVKENRPFCSKECVQAGLLKISS